MKKIYTVAKYAKSIMLAAVMTASALTTVNAQKQTTLPMLQQKPTAGGEAKR